MGNKIVMTPYQQEMLKALTKVKEYKKPIEANIIGCMFKNSELYYDCELTLDHFSHNEWKVYFAIIKNLIEVEKKEVLDEITVGLFLEKHDKLRAKYEEYGEYITIDNLTKYIVIENFNGYLEELKKWNVVIDLIKKKFPVFDMISDFADMKAEDIYNYYEAQLNHMFSNIDGDYDVYNLCDGANELIDELNKGVAVGLPLHNAPALTKLIGGCLEGNVSLMGGLSGTGKSLTTMQWLLPSIIESGEKIVLLINEESKDKWTTELIIWVCNNIYNKNIPKYVIRNGKYDKETLDALRLSADWVEQKKKNKQIMIVPFKSYKCSTAIKVIKKFSALNYKYFILDTFKASDDAKPSEKMWESMQKDSVRLYDIAKPAGKNIHLWITFQLGKQSAKQRYYSLDNIGQSKSIVDIASSCTMIRRVFPDEYEGEKKELKCWTFGGKNGKSQIPFTLQKGKHFIIIFVVKTRANATNEYQIVAENDLSKNIFREVAFTEVPLDW